MPKATEPTRASEADNSRFADAPGHLHHVFNSLEAKMSYKIDIKMYLCVYICIYILSELQVQDKTAAKSLNVIRRSRAALVPKKSDNLTIPWLKRINV